MNAKARSLEKQRRKKKREAVQTGKRKAEAAQIRGFLERLGLWKELRLFGCERAIMYPHYPPIVIEADVDASDAHAEHVLAELQGVLQSAVWTVPGLDWEVNAQEFIRLILPALFRIQSAVGEDRKGRAFQRKVRASTQAIPAGFVTEQILKRLLWELRKVLIKHGRINTALYYLDLLCNRDARRRLHIVLILHKEKVRTARHIVDGNVRTAFQCGQPYLPGGIDWVYWPPEVVDRPAGSDHIPVFIQRHTFDRLYGPKGRLSVLVRDEDMLHDAIWSSLRDPVVRTDPLRPDVYLIDYVVGDYRLGYLVARLLPDAVVVQSFLFLTMDGTPEGNALRERLRLLRSDKSYLRLDELETFVTTDLGVDPHMVSLFTKCGCGELFEAFECIGPRVNGVADQVRRYIGAKT